VGQFAEKPQDEPARDPLRRRGVAHAVRGDAADGFERARDGEGAGAHTEHALPAACVCTLLTAVCALWVLQVRVRTLDGPLLEAAVEGEGEQLARRPPVEIRHATIAPGSQWIADATPGHTALCYVRSGTVRVNGSHTPCCMHSPLRVCVHSSHAAVCAHCVCCRYVRFVRLHYRSVSTGRSSAR
jgi:hypothetical protein